MEVDRSPGTGLALALLASAATARLRHELGVTYHVGADYQLAGPDQAHLTIAADCLDTNAEQVASTLLAVIDNIASHGPEEADMELERERFRRAVRAPADAVEWFATGDLIGVTPRKVARTSDVGGPSQWGRRGCSRPGRCGKNDHDRPVARRAADSVSAVSTFQ